MTLTDEQEKAVERAMLSIGFSITVEECRSSLRALVREVVGPAEVSAAHGLTEGLHERVCPLEHESGVKLYCLHCRWSASETAGEALAEALRVALREHHSYAQIQAGKALLAWSQRKPASTSTTEVK